MLEFLKNIYVKCLSCSMKLGRMLDKLEMIEKFSQKLVNALTESKGPVRFNKNHLPSFEGIPRNLGIFEGQIQDSYSQIFKMKFWKSLLK